MNKFLPIEDEEILNPSLDASILNAEIFREDFDGAAKLIVPIRKAITTKMITYSIFHLMKNIFNNFWSLNYEPGINLH